MKGTRAAVRYAKGRREGTHADRGAVRSDRRLARLVHEHHQHLCQIRTDLCKLQQQQPTTLIENEKNYFIHKRRICFILLHKRIVDQ